MKDEKTRTLRVTLAIEVRDMTEQELLDSGYGSDFGFDDGDEELGSPSVTELAAREIAELIPHTLTFDETQDEMFAGTAIFARLKSAKVESAEWAAALSTPQEKAGG